MLSDESLSSPLDPFRVDHLIMLVGGNPLPNAVSAPLLTRRGARITLLHSTETEEVAKHIRDSFDPSLGLRPILKSVDVSDRVSISTAISQALKDNQSTIGLHFTGGTKSMSVHAFRAVEQFSIETEQDVIFSYLDARHLNMMIDHFSNGKFPANSRSIYVGQTPFHLQKMLKLHNWELPHQPHTRLILPKSTGAIAKVNASGRFRDWITWKNKIVGAAKHEQWDPRNRENRVTWTNTVQPLPSENSLADVRKALEEELNIKNGLLDLELARNHVFASLEVSASLEFLGEYIESKWLEALAFNTFLDLKPQFGLEHVNMSVKPFLIDNSAVNFELDCVAVRGYQLFAVSCIIDGGKEARNHLFEAYIRARQIGGDEARLALVCVVDDPDLLREKIRRDIDPAARIKVFGKHDLTHLKDRFGSWIQEASHGRDRS